jgi:lipopolysaccharide/colanic/teichoic acid biosynthesis glycosyltransferase
MIMKTRSLPFWILTADLVWIPAALWLAVSQAYGFAWNLFSPDRLWIAAPVVITTGLLWSIFSSAMKLDGAHDGWWFPAVASRVFLAECGILGALLAARYPAHWPISRLVLAAFTLNLTAGSLALRYSVRALIRLRYRRGKVHRAAIVGHDRVAREVAAKIDRHPELLWQVVGFFVLEDVFAAGADGETASSDSADGNPARTLSTLGVLDTLRVERVEELIVTTAGPFPREVLNLLARCRQSGIHVSLVPQPYELYLSRPRVLDLDGVPLLELNEASGAAARPWKRALDLALGSLLFVAALPILLPCVLWLYASRGRALVCEARCGRLGKPFPMLRLNLERHRSHATWSERVLENLSLTELPQLWNVLRGEMSLVGPRPEAPERVKHYSEWQAQRLSVTPGIVGLAQVHGLREHSSSEDKTRFDLQYLLDPSPLTDLALLLQTIWTLAMRLVRSPASPASAWTGDNAPLPHPRRDPVPAEPVEGVV